MSSSAYAKPLRLKPRPSRILVGLTLFGHAGAILLLATAPMDPRAALVGTLGAVVSWLAALVRLHGPGAIHEAVWTVDDVWELRLRSGRTVQARLADDSFSHPLLVVLNFRAHIPVPAVVLFRNEPTAEIHRQLRVRLRLFRSRKAERPTENRRLGRLLNRWRSHLPE